EHFANTAPAVGYIGVDHHAGFHHLPMLQELRARCPHVQHILVHGQTDAYTTLEQVCATGRDATIPATDARPADVAFLQISGGSTGLSKLIPRTHDDYIYTLRESARICGLSEQSVFLGALPIAHNFPMSSPGFLGTLYAGGRVVLSPSPAPEVCFALIEQEKVTQCSLVPPLLMLWLDAAERNKPDLSSLQVIQVGGAKLIPE